MSSPEPITFVIDGPGHQETVVLEPVGGEIRFSIGEPGCHAAIWLIWATKNNPSVYIANRQLRRPLKISQHPTDEGKKWWFQWTQEHMDADPQVPHVDERQIDHWLNPPELGETGWAKGFSIWTRHQDVVHTPDEPDLATKKVMWLSGPPEGHATCIDVVIARPTNKFVEINGGIPVGAFALSDGQVVLLVESHHPITDEMNSAIRDAVTATVIQSVPEADRAGILSQPPGKYRTFYWRDGPDGDKQAWDLAVGV